MNPRLVKEIRELAIWPATAALILFALMPLLDDPAAGAHWSRYVFGLYLVVGVFAPSARLFGAELDRGTIERLLSQPVTRSQIWREKLGALGACTVVAFAVLQLARHLFEGPGSALIDVEVCLVALSGGPLFALASRQSLLGLGGAVAAPMTAIWVWVYLLYLVRGDFESGFTWSHLPPMLLYVPVAYVLGRRRWLKLELDHGATGRVRVPAWLRPRGGSKVGPSARLALKELQVQSANLLLVPASLAIFGVACGLTLTVEPEPGLLGRSVVFLRLLVSFLLVCLLPLLLGASSVASERQLGVAEWQSGLPVSRGRQWALKLMVVMSVATFAGGVPAAYLDRWLFDLMTSNGFDAPPILVTVVWLSVPVLAAAAGIYASSRAREPFRAVLGGVAILVFMLIPSTIPAAHELRGVGLPGGLPLLTGVEVYVGVTAASLALLAVAFTQFRPEPWVWSRGAGPATRSVLLAALLLSIGVWFTTTLPS